MDLARVGVHGGVRAARLCGQGSQRLKGWRGVRARRLGAGRDSAMRGAVAAGAARIWRRVGARVVLLPFWCGARYGCGEAWVALSARLRARGDSEELIQGAGLVNLVSGGRGGACGACVVRLLLGCGRQPWWLAVFGTAPHSLPAWCSAGCGVPLHPVDLLSVAII